MGHRHKFVHGKKQLSSVARIVVVRAAVNNRSHVNLIKEAAVCVRFTTERFTDLGERYIIIDTLSLVSIALG